MLRPSELPIDCDDCLLCLFVSTRPPFSFPRSSLLRRVLCTVYRVPYSPTLSYTALILFPYPLLRILILIHSTPVPLFPTYSPHTLASPPRLTSSHRSLPFRRHHLHYHVYSSSLIIQLPVPVSNSHRIPIYYYYYYYYSYSYSRFPQKPKIDPPPQPNRLFYSVRSICLLLFS